jgi:F-type H+-transporting ATPase subunit gamma
MQNQLICKNKIKGFQDVQQTVKTVEKIAASHAHFLKRKVGDLKLYSTEIEKILARLSNSYSATSRHHLLKSNPFGLKAILIISADKGLAGGLYHNLINFFLSKAKEYSKIYVIGAKALRFLRDEGIKADKTEYLPLDFSETPSAEEINKIIEYIFKEFKENRLSQVDILYPQFVSLVKQQPRIVNFLPFKFEIRTERDDSVFSNSSNLGLPIFVPSKKIFFNSILQKHIKTFFCQIIMEAKLSEVAARASAMEHAKEVTKKFIHQLKITYFKERRRATTQKQLESFVVHRIGKT